MPKPREPTKWEKFAAEKGIGKNKTRGKKVFDEVSQVSIFILTAYTTSYPHPTIIQEWKPR